MAESSRLKAEKREGTVFYRRRIGDWLRRYVIELVILALAIIFGIVTTVITMNARRVFREAKDVRYALKFVGTQYYGNGTSIYDPSKPTGLAEGAAEAIAEVSTQNGQVFLYAWDEKESMPLRFEYRKGAYTVVYIADVANSNKDNTNGTGLPNQLMGHWDVTYSFNVLTYDSE